MKSLLGVLIAALMAVTVAVAPASAGDDAKIGAELDVMSLNMYIGADLSRVLPPEPEPPAAVFQTALESDFVDRTLEMANEIKTNQPDLVGLQEVTQIRLFDSSFNELGTIDYLGILLGALNFPQPTYVESSTVVNANVILPIIPPVQGASFAQVIDRDVIIHNVATTTVSNPYSANYSTNFTVSLGGIPIEFTRGYTMVDATVGETTFRFVNTHLEVENAPCLTPGGLVVCQNVQATELIDTLYTETLPLVLVGDFNAAPGEFAYQTVVDRGYKDTWNSDSGPGYTCCRTELLDDDGTGDDALDRRIDHIFTRRRAVKVDSATTQVLTGRTPEGLWYSDHGAPFADLDLTINTNVQPGEEFEPGDD